MYAVKYCHAELISGQLLAAAELRQIIIYNYFVFFSLREIRSVARLVYQHFRVYYDAKATAVKRVLDYRPRVQDKLNITLLTEMVFQIEGLEDKLIDMVEQLSHS